MSPDPQPRAGEMSWRMDHIEREVVKMSTQVDQIPLLSERTKVLSERLEAIQRVLWTIAGGLVLLVISVLIAAAQFGGA